MMLGNNVSKSFKRGFNPCKISANGLVTGFLDKITLKALIPNSIPCSKFTDKSLESLFKFSNSAQKSFEKERLIFSNL
ncbi:Hypothetical protein HP17_01098 [Helicobacter pylori NCTC 11637 = CCUG 17874 = ATCC 43504 = JCM 12093]|nr:Hypothetical protein HP17_01098 [Helicobacter pylori NCTC 11637 = CCUG 17874 = ATCC 43504 = JCM 12093]